MIYYVLSIAKKRRSVGERIAVKVTTGGVKLFFEFDLSQSAHIENVATRGRG